MHEGYVFKCDRDLKKTSLRIEATHNPDACAVLPDIKGKTLHSDDKVSSRTNFIVHTYVYIHLEEKTVLCCVWVSLLRNYSQRRKDSLL